MNLREQCPVSLQFAAVNELTINDLIDRIEEQVKSGNRMVEEEMRSTNTRVQELQQTKTRTDEELRLTEARIDELNLIKKRVEEKWKMTKTRHFARLKRIFEAGNCTSAQRNLRLEFRHKISQPILTGEEIKGDGNTFIEVALIDAKGNVVDTDPEASVDVEIVVLNGKADSWRADDSTVGEFKDKIVQEMEGKKPFLAGNVCLKLQRGVAVLNNVKFRNHTIKMKPPLFRLGARVVDKIFDGVHVKEAETESFTVEGYRKKYYRKHKTPSLSDEVSRLINIGRGGEIEKRLQEKNIYTVEDFLIQLLINPEGLKRIVNVRGKKWDTTVKNARACQNSKRMYCYINHQLNIGVVFSVLGEVSGLYLKTQYVPTTLLSDNHKLDAEELLASAYKHWRDVMSFDDENSLLQYFTGLSTFMDPLNSLKPHRHHGGCEMIRGSSSRSNFLFQSITSATNSTRKTGAEDFCSFSTDDVETIFDAPVQLSPQLPFYPETMLSDLDEFFHQNDDSNWQVNSPVNEPNRAEQVAETAVAFDDTHIRNPPNRWRKLFCVSRWFSIRKSISMAGIHNRKKQKLY
ncbi:calmodulin-binding protein 60 A-like isoform X1 [Sesamum indicum]|uniref:Calmodulin-binding protein 60 A-like isoform X1 n=1 Tax=Sesamum indicum TaxID=4182 RepID=A0A8M8UWN3_SESIN|nr:calmodulin-binding protein 60 A-like isoform X1 [Sesamum indicum]